MDKIIEAILKAVPFSSLLEKLGCSSETSAALSVILIAILLFAISSFYKYFKQHYENSKVANDLSYWFDYQYVKATRAFFIPTQFQNESPTWEEEPGFSFSYVSKNPLIPHFIAHAFDEKRESNKFYLILADSGMGKTTFLINLYDQYYSFFNFKRKYKMRLFLFRDERILDTIKKISQEEAKNTILLLDAFDEDKKLLDLEENKGLTDEQRFRRRMDEIIDATRDFREVVITSRTQYFPGQEAKPYELKIPRFDGKGFHILAKMYLSPFDKKETKRYLTKKYGRLKFWNWKKKELATRLVNNVHKLMVRPMLLSNIDYLVDSQKDFKNTYEIYETLIEKWVEREADNRKKMSERTTFKKDLHQYSQLVALKIYEERKASNFFHLEKQKAIQVARQHDIHLENYEITGQSLLTRDAEGNWKFAHKSILEYFIAKKVLEDAEFASTIDFTGMDMAQQFCREVVDMNMVFVEGGTFQMGSKNFETEQPIHQVQIPDFYMGTYPLTQKQWKLVMNNNPSQFEGDDLPVENVSWYDAQDFIKKLNKITNRKYRLSSESEWEFAARGGNSSKGFEYAGSNNIDKVAWYHKNSNGKTHPVGQKKPNELGLYDMSGNVWEWCADHWHDNYNNAPEDGSAWLDFNQKEKDIPVVRGGSWGNLNYDCRVSNRFRYSATNRFDFIGFRLSRY